MTRAAPAALAIEVLVVGDRWPAAGKFQAVVRRAIAQAAAMLSTTGSELAIVLADDSTIRALNRHWRGIDAATNVLSFPAKNAKGRQRGRQLRPYLGDVVLAYETIEREALSERKPLSHHVAHLAVHGFLHLVGYDHERQTDAVAMERTERDILRRLSIPDPYRPATERKSRQPARRLVQQRARRVAKASR
jgi:probable rRNA maturation factor